MYKVCCPKCKTARFVEVRNRTYICGNCREVYVATDVVPSTAFETIRMPGEGVFNGLMGILDKIMG